MKVFKVKIRNAEEIVYEGEVTRISSFNEVGPFDIYPMHANFISIMRKKLTLYNGHDEIKSMDFEQAILKVKQDVAHIFLGIEVLYDDQSK